MAIAAIGAAGQLLADHAPPAAARPALGPITGPPHVIDGDTIEIGNLRIRLWGIDAPNRSSDAGAETVRVTSAAGMQRLSGAN
jgi:endonuclease YncB( thermonuclease family)